MDSDRNIDLDITFEYHPEAEHLKAGLVSDHLFAFQNGKKVGYLKIDRIDPVLFKQECPDIWAFQQEFSGKLLFGDTTQPISKKPFSELVRALRSGYLYRHVKHWCEEMKWPLDQINTISKIIHEYNSPMSDWINHEDLVIRFFIEWPSKTQDGRQAVRKMKERIAHSTKPFVAYINTKENKHQGVDADNSKKGIGTLLYKTGATWIKDRKLGPGLYASSLQSDDAQAIWKKFERDGMVVIDGSRKYIKG
jgi:hypothetical protein